MKLRSFTIVALTSICAISAAQMSLVSRTSKVNYAYLCGFAGDTRTGSNSSVSGALLGSDSLGLVGSTTESGVSPNWSATVGWDLGHAFSVAGTATNFGSLSASGHSNTSASVSSTSVVGDIGANQPGNILTLGFTLNNSSIVDISGSLAQIGATNNNASGVALYSGSGTSRTLIWVTSILNGNFDQQLNLAAGNYEIESGAVSGSSGNGSNSSQYSYSLAVVPEPATVLLITPLLYGLRRRRNCG